MSEQRQPNGRSLIDYCQRFAQLNVSSTKKRGVAKYKPILLLSVIELIVQGSIRENKIFVSDELIDTFNKYWETLESDYKGGLHYPFFYLQSEGFWSFSFKPNFKGMQPKTLNKLREAVEYAKLDDELFELLMNESSRKELIDTLVFFWMSEKENDLQKIIQINQSIQKNNDPDKENTFKMTTRRSIIRDAFFRKSVVYIYEEKCAFCGLKISDPLEQNIIDGAHIKPFSLFYDNTVANGIAFCKNHHWAFDRGWFAIDDQYRILVSQGLKEESPNCRSLQEFNGESICLPISQLYFPQLDSLKWHRDNIFRTYA